jgi:hypothetical protein
MSNGDKLLGHGLEVWDLHFLALPSPELPGNVNGNLIREQYLCEFDGGF